MLTGLRGRHGQFFDRLGLLCRPVRTDGTLGAETIRGGEAGGTGGDAVAARCTTGSVLTKLTVLYGSFVGEIIAGCRTWDASRRTTDRGAVSDFTSVTHSAPAC